MSPGSRPRIAVVSGDFPAEQDILHIRTCADVVNDQVTTSLGSLTVDDHSNVRNISAQVPGDKITGRVILRPRAQRQFLALTAEKDHQVRDATMVDACFR